MPNYVLVNFIIDTIIISRLNLIILRSKFNDLKKVCMMDILISEVI